MKTARRASYWRCGAQEGSRKKRQQGASSTTGIPRCEVNSGPICGERVAEGAAPSKGRATASGGRSREMRASDGPVAVPRSRQARHEKWAGRRSRAGNHLTEGRPGAAKSRRKRAPGAPRCEVERLRGNRRSLIKFCMSHLPLTLRTRTGHTPTATIIRPGKRWCTRVRQQRCGEVEGAVSIVWVTGSGELRSFFLIRSE